MRILVVEDHARIASFVRKGLEEEGFVVDVVDDGARALTELLDRPPDACVLDVMLPSLDGFEVVRRARAGGATSPVLLLSARGEVDDRVRGLSAGADDYLPKPFAFEELVARLRALLRRGAASSSVLAYADVTLDLARREARRGGRRVDLTPREWALLELFLRRPEIVLSRTVIGQKVFGLHFDPGTNVVDVYVGYLRRKLHEAGPPLIHTVRGAGYVLRAGAPS
ncbi:MAG: response regulator transcription factor [Planctomycetes bacterium]|nr:response regulator transcription factor [Planctomycetota bacterium]